MAGDRRPTSRRRVLAGAAAGLGLGAGCLASAGGEERVSMLAAGSLATALEHGLEPRLDASLRVEARGSLELARQVAAGQKDPDVVAVADESLFGSILESAWYASYATNGVVLAYNPDTDGGRRIAAASPDAWYEPLLEESVTLGRTDPALDPLGYRTLFTLELASAHYGTPDALHEAIPRRNQLYPETQLIGQLETGSIDAAFAYRNMAVERDYAYVDLPPEIDLSEPRYTDRYASVSYEAADGTVIRGGPIRYAATARSNDVATLDVFEASIEGEYLEEFGFSVPDDYPRFTQHAPESVRG